MPSVVLAGLLGCGTTEPAPTPRGRFTLTITGATDTTVTGGIAAWTDLSNAGDPSVEHTLIAWADGSGLVPAVSLSMVRGTTAPALATGAMLRRGEGSILNSTLWLACPPQSMGMASCTGQFGARDGAPVAVSLTRVESDTVGGALEFGASGWLTGGPTAGAPPDTVTVRLDFVVPRQRERVPGASN